MTSKGKLTKEHLAARLGFSTRQLDYLVQRKELPPGTRCGRQLYWHESVPQAWEERIFAAQLAWAERVGQAAAAAEAEAEVG